MVNTKEPKVDKDGNPLYEYEIKLRGICQDILTDRLLCYEKFVRNVQNYGRFAAVGLRQQRFFPDLKKGIVSTAVFDKFYDVVMPKGIIDNVNGGSLRCYPFGY